MHMADALISPAVGGALWLVSGGWLAYCARKVRHAARANLVPLMGVLGAFVFAAQMINFSIPLTGSSGHLGGALLLTIFLGPHAAFLVIASVLTVQAFFFADGGLLALGCNLFNLGFFPAFVAYPLIYRPLAGETPAGRRARLAAVLAAVAGLQLGALGVVVETWASGISELPFGVFVRVMLPIHLAIGLIEGLATAAVVGAVARTRPDALPTAAPVEAREPRRVLLGFLLAALILGGVASWFASTHPDGLEWALARITGKEEFTGEAAPIHRRLAGLQAKTAFLPDYGFKANEAEVSETSTSAPWPAVHAGTSLAGLIGGGLTLAFACALGFALRVAAWRRRTAS
jgi:cobalt/nickel transport system permease protein